MDCWSREVLEFKTPLVSFVFEVDVVFLRARIWLYANLRREGVKRAWATRRIRWQKREEEESGQQSENVAVEKKTRTHVAARDGRREHVSAAREMLVPPCRSRREDGASAV